MTARGGLPKPLRALLEASPRNGWTQDGNFDGLVAFWLDRHLMFRRLLATLRQDAETRIGGDMDAMQHGQRLQSTGSLLVSIRPVRPF